MAEHDFIIFIPINHLLALQSSRTPCTGISYTRRKYLPIWRPPTSRLGLSSPIQPWLRLARHVQQRTTDIMASSCPVRFTFSFLLLTYNRQSSSRSHPTILFLSHRPMGCCASTPAIPLSPPLPTTTPLSNPTHEAPPTVSSPGPNTVKRAPLPSSNGSSGPAHDLAQRDIETTKQTPTQAQPAPNAYASLPSRNRDTARALQSPSLAVPASPSFPTEGTPVSSPSQRLAGVTTYPPAQHKTETPKHQPHEHNRKRHAPSAFQPPSIKKSVSAQPLSRSGLPAPSSPPLAKAVSASGSGPEAEFRNRPRGHSPSTQGTSKAPVAGDDGNQRFPSTVRTVLSDNSRYAPNVVS